MHILYSMANKAPIRNNIALTTVLILSSLAVPTADALLGQLFGHFGRAPVQNSNNAVTSTQPKAIFILAGQSNMAGRGGVYYWPKPLHWDHITPDDIKPDNSTIFRLTAQLGWEGATEPLHHDIDPKMCGVGPGMAFANAVKGQVGTTIGLVPCAVGDTHISQWQRGEDLYENMTRRAKVAARGGEIKALLWYQGEADTLPDRVNVYKSNMEKLIQNLREDLNLPSLPVIQVALAFPTGKEDSEISRCGNSYCVDEIRKIQKVLKLPNVVTVDANGLENKGAGDYIHLTTNSQIKVGHMMAEAYLNNFLAPASSPAAPSPGSPRPYGRS